MTHSNGQPSTTSEMLAVRRRGLLAGPESTYDERGYLVLRRITTTPGGFRVREHQGFGHGLAPGTDRDLGCPSCTREDTRCPDCGGAYRDVQGQYVPHLSFCPAVSS